MDFISLEEVIESMAKRDIEKISYQVLCPDEQLDIEKCNSDAAFARAKHYSDAAAKLHRELHNNNETRPRWVAISDKTGQPLINDAASIEGMGILEHMAGWDKRLAAEHCKYLTECEQAESAGIDVLSIRPSRKLGDGPYTRHGYFQALRIGFDRAELDAFLAVEENSQPQFKKPILKFPAQEEAILRAIQDRGHDPKALPARRNSQKWVKSEVWDVLKSEKSIFQSKSTFDKAWERLRADKRIV